MFQAFRKNLKRAITILLGVSVIVTLLYSGGQLSRLEWLSYDWRMHYFRSDKQINENVAVVLIDDASLKALDPLVGRWPWPRSIYADLLDFFAAGNPKAVLFDITFGEKQLRNNSADKGLSEQDKALVDASKQNPFAYHAVRFLLDKKDERNDSLLNQPLPDRFIEKFSLQHRYAAKIKSDTQYPNNNYYLPFDKLWQASSGIGVVDFNADDDGVYRRARLFHQYGNVLFPSLSTTALLDQKKPKAISVENHFVTVDDIGIPVDNQDEYWVNFYGNYNAYSFSGIIASLQQMQQGELENLLISPYEFENKYVFIGGSAAGLEDLKTTPVNGRTPGVFLHASIASNILEHDFITPPNTQLTYVMIVVFAALAAFGVLGLKNLFIQNGLPIMLGGAYVLFSMFMFKHNQVVEVVAPLLSIGGSWATSFSSLLLIEGREKRKFKRMMSQYLSPAVLNTVVNNQEEFAKAEVGSKECITILFSDIRGFTNMSEKLPPEQVVEILNFYFSKMTDAIFKFEGTIDKFIGDAIMAFWGAPIRTEDHADKTTLAALEMTKRLGDVNKWLREKNLPTLNIGIGIHTGEAILGNIGSENKLDYTIIGDNVNLASRMEGLTKQYGVEVLITEATYHDLQIEMPCRLLDLVRVKGKEKPIKIYQPLLDPNAASEHEKAQAEKLARDAARAFDAYLNREWETALQLFATLPDDTASNLLKERCIAYRAQEPKADWDGVFVMKTK